MRIGQEQEGQEQVPAKRKAWGMLKKAQASCRRPTDAIPKTATTRSSQRVCESNKHQGAASKVVIQESPIAIDSGESEWAGIGWDRESGDFDEWSEGVEATIVMQPIRCSLVYFDLAVFRHILGSKSSKFYTHLFVGGHPVTYVRMLH